MTFYVQDVYGLQSGYSWPTSNLTYSFPTAASNYGSDYGAGEPDSGFTLSMAQQNVVQYALKLISQYTLLTFTQITESDSTHATLRFADSAVPESSYTYKLSSSHPGDVWFGSIRFEAPTKGSYAFSTILHETGHAVGLKHGHELDPAGAYQDVYGVLPPEHDSSEWSLMTYHNYLGGGLDYTISDGSGNQTYMIDDIAALQYLYGANFNTYSGNTVYTWSPTTGETFIDGVGQGASSANKVYEAIWDGGGIDTYNLSNYSTNLVVDLRPGEWSTFSPNQLADLDNAAPGVHLAVGNVANAQLYNDDPRSLIENAIGGSGNDRLIGNQVNNMLAGGAGNDTVDGGAGSDTASYADATGAVTVSLAISTPQNTIGAGTDTLTNIENLTGSAFNDTLTGNAGANILSGLAGNDTLNGGAGNDSMDGGAGGSDTASYQAGATAGVTVSLATSTAQNTIGAGTDTLVNFENLTGTAFNDTLTGNAGANILSGLAGNDTLNGGAGNDSMDGGAAGSDTASYQAGATAGVTVSLATSTAQNTIGAGTDTLVNFENLTGTAFNDTLTGNAGANILSGLAGNDTLNGGAGNDSMDGGAAGSDTASYQAGATAGVTVSLATSTAQNTIGAGTDTLVNFENLTGTAFNDTLTGNAGANILSGLAGNDTLNGGAGNDSMDGGAAGSDTASYIDATAGVTVSLALTAAQNTIGAGTDTLFNFESLTGSNFNDTLSGNSVANILNGGAGNDTLIGAAGNDTLIGAVGNDVMNGGAGNDSMDGGAAGTDTVTYSDATAGVTVNLALGTAQNTVGSGTDTLFNFENLTGSNFNDKLTGNAAANTLYGLGGNDSLNGAAGIDTLSGAAGNDRLIGGAGNDSLDGGVGTDSFVFDKAFGKDTITGFVAAGAGHDTIDFSTATFGSFAAIKSHMVQSGANVVITLDSADTITLKGVTLASLSAADFSFHASSPGLPAAAPMASPDNQGPMPAEQLWADHSAHFNASIHFA